jgi:hypothetical protein
MVWKLQLQVCHIHHNIYSFFLCLFCVLLTRLLSFCWFHSVHASFYSWIFCLSIFFSSFFCVTYLKKPVILSVCLWNPSRQNWTTNFHCMAYLMRFIYLQYWFQEDVKESFLEHRVVLNHRFASAHMHFPKKKMFCQFWCSRLFLV